MQRGGQPRTWGFILTVTGSDSAVWFAVAFSLFYFEISFQSRENDSVTHRVIHRPGFCAYILYLSPVHWASWVVLVVKSPPANVGDLGSVPRLGRSPGGGHGNPFQYSCLENSP